MSREHFIFVMKLYFFFLHNLRENQFKGFCGVISFHNLLLYILIATFQLVNLIKEITNISSLSVQVHLNVQTGWN